MGRLRQLRLSSIAWLELRRQRKLPYFNQRRERDKSVQPIFKTTIVPIALIGEECKENWSQHIFSSFTLLKRSIGRFCWILFFVWKLNSCSKIRTWLYYIEIPTTICQEIILEKHIWLPLVLCFPALYFWIHQYLLC